MPCPERRWGGKGTRFKCLPPVQLFGLVLLWGIPIVVGGCGLEAPMERLEGVDFTSSHISVGELQDRALLMLLIQAEYESPVVEAKITFPNGAEPWGTPLMADDSWYRSASDFKGDPPWIEVKGGAIPPGEGGTLVFRIGALGAREGDTLSFPVELTLEDGAIVEWTGPPSSDKPAPTVVVGEAQSRDPSVVLLVVAALAFLVLLAAGVFMLRQHRRRPK